MESLVTIAIPFYNDSKFLRMSILSVINQSYANWKLILIDDGSTDGSIDIARSFTYDDRISVISDGQNKGLPYRLNQISSIVKTIYYARMDADDIMHPDRLKTQLRYLQDNPEIDVLGTLAYVIDDNNKMLGKTTIKTMYPKSLNDILSGSSFIHPSIMGKTVWFQSHPYDINLVRMQDLALWMSTVESSVFQILPEYLLYYRTGSYTINKYLKTQEVSRSFFYNTIYKKKKRVSLFLSLYIKSIMKSLIYYTASRFSNMDKIVQRRYLSISQEEQCLALDRMKESLKTNNLQATETYRNR